ncbi:hypothetical protein RF11_16162 [Thelohanellus kitauei]|uniref:Uncharacterized protein n=1 Tax=Thelohanellus kitauei TaxID=669202 RepID=A0A0C2NKN3_THEKT|nr:hypothetical protein RF11_16162 [Thelohanellus kitauei]
MSSIDANHVVGSTHIQHGDFLPKTTMYSYKFGFDKNDYSPTLSDGIYEDRVVILSNYTPNSSFHKSLFDRGCFFKLKNFPVYLNGFEEICSDEWWILFFGFLYTRSSKA